MFNSNNAKNNKSNSSQKVEKMPLFTQTEANSLKVIFCLLLFALIPVIMYNPYIPLGPLDNFRKDFFKTELIISGSKYNPDGLVKAIVSNDIQKVRLYTNSRMDLNELTRSGKSPLCVACEFGNTEIVSTLLQGNVNLIRRNSSDGMTPVFCAVKSNNVKILEKLKNQGIRLDVRSPYNNGISPLHYAASLGHDSIVAYLIKNGVDVNSVDLSGKTPLHMAASQSNPIVVIELINFGASLNAKSDDGKTPLDIATETKNIYIEKILKRAGAQKSAYSENETAPAEQTVKNNNRMN